MRGATSVYEPKRSFKQNPVVASVRILAAAFAIILLAMILVMTIPVDLGAPYEPLEAGDSYTFDPWEISLGRLHISYPRGGVLVGAYRRGELTALVLLGEGTAIFHADNGESEFPVAQVVLQAHPSEISVLRGQTYIDPQVLPESMQQADALLKNTASGEPVLELLGTKRVYVPRRGVLRVEMFSPDNQQAHYTQAARSVWNVPGEPALIISTPDALHYPPHDQFLFSLSIFSVMVAAVGAGIIFVTPHYLHSAPRGRKGMHFLWPMALVIVHSLTEAYLTHLKLSPFVMLGWRVMVVAVTLWIADTYGEAFAFLGLRRKGLLPAIGVGVLCGFLLYLCGSIALPEGLNNISIPEVLTNLVSIFLLRAVFQELLWRGLVQGSLRQGFGGFTSIALTAALAALASLAPAALSGQYGTALYIQSFFIVPLCVFILGFVYERTHNLFAPIATVTLLGLIPFILHF